MIDSHCHLDFAELGAEREAVLDRGRAAGITCFVTIGANDGTRSAPDAVALAQAHRDVVATVGVHPHDASCVDDSAVEEITRLGRNERVVAIGEVGLDFHYDLSPREVQIVAFRRFVSAARELKKPLVIHTRSAPSETLEVLRSEGARDVGGVIHCFTENASFARAALDLGFDISFSGIVTFKRSDELREVARTVPLDRMMIETDSPFLAPLPYRGKRNEPSYLASTAEHLAHTLAVDIAELRARTADTTIRRFALAKFGVQNTYG